jgi:hypothetical protein
MDNLKKQKKNKRKTNKINYCATSFLSSVATSLSVVSKESSSDIPNIFQEIFDESSLLSFSSSVEVALCLPKEGFDPDRGTARNELNELKKRT